MRILIICKYGDEIDNNKTDRLNNISSVYGYFFRKNLFRFSEEYNFKISIDCKGMNVDFNDLDIYDHCFYLYNRGIKLLPEDKFKILRNKITQKIFTIAPTSKIQGEEDCLLFFAGKVKSNSLRINLVSDENDLIPQQNNDKIRILVDHEYYGKKDSRIFKNDKTKIIIKSLLDFKEKWTGKPIEIIQINTIDPKGFSIINNINDINNYDRTIATSFKNIYKIYCSSDIFVVTHEEALGLSCVECNQAGCKVVSPDGYIKHIYGEKLDIEYIKEDNYNWDEIINKLNPTRTKFKVRNQTYMKALKYIFKKLKL